MGDLHFLIPIMSSGGWIAPKRKVKTEGSKTSKKAKKAGIPSIKSIIKNASMPVSVVHRTVGAINYNSSGGFGGTGYSLTFAFTQNQAYYSANGGAYIAWGAGYDNTSALSNVYDMYRVKTIWMDFYPSVTDYPVGTASTLAPPLMYAVVDYTDANALLTANQALAYGDVKVYQLVASGTNDSGKPRFRLRINKPAVNVNVDSITTGVTTNSMNARGPWLYCSNTTAEHGFAKIYVDSAITTLAVTMNLQIVINAEYEYKNVK